MCHHILASDKILEIVRGWDTLTFSSTQEVLHDWICMIAKRDLDWSVKAMDIPFDKHEHISHKNGF